MDKRKIHMTAICGTGMGSLASLLVAQGHEVRGSDQQVYPPMSTQITKLGIDLMEGFDAANLDWNPDLVIIGNAVARDNPESRRVEAEGRELLSMPAALARFFLRQRHPVVVAGTHGKTTTSALATWVLHHAGRAPGALVGGVMNNFGATSILGEGDEFVVEGDEYDSAWFDKESKFFHYLPQTAILTSLELDHVDIFPSFAALKRAFRRFVALLDADGLLVACKEYPDVVEVSAACAGSVLTYGLNARADWSGTVGTVADGWMELEVREGRRWWGPYRSPLVGRHNLLNIVGVMAAVKESFGIDPDRTAQALTEFKGIKRRQEVRGIAADVTVIDDFAHHPRAVTETIAATRMAYPGQRLWAVFEPCTNTSRTNVFQEQYQEAFADVGAGNEVIIAAINKPEKVADPTRRLDVAQLVAGLRAAGVAAQYIAEVEEIIYTVVHHSQPGDVVLCMSNGGFGNIHTRLLTALEGDEQGS